MHEDTVMDLVLKQIDGATDKDDMSLFIMPDPEDHFEPAEQRYIKLEDPAVQIGLDRLARL
jgi:hypothetical protein